MFRKIVLLLVLIILSWLETQELYSAILRNIVALRVAKPLGSSSALDSSIDDWLESVYHLSSIDWATRRLLGLAYLRDRQVTLAISVLDTESSKCSDQVSCFFHGQALYLNNQLDIALDRWRQIPHVDVFFALQGDVAYASSEKEQALQFYQLSWTIAPTVTTAKHKMLLNLCRDRRERGLGIEAVQWCERARCAKSDYWTLVELGRTYYEAGQYASAEAVLRQAIDMLPNQAGAYQWLGLTLYRMHRIEDGIVALSTSVRLSPSGFWARLELANLLLQQKDYLAAACEYSIALGLAPEPLQRQMIEEKIQTIPLSREELGKCDREYLAR